MDKSGKKKKKKKKKTEKPSLFLPFLPFYIFPSFPDTVSSPFFPILGYATAFLTKIPQNGDGKLA